MTIYPRGFHDLGEPEDGFSTRSSEKAEASPSPIYYHMSALLPWNTYVNYQCSVSRKLTNAHVHNEFGGLHQTSSKRKDIQLSPQGACINTEGGTGV